MGQRRTTRNYLLIAGLLGLSLVGLFVLWSPQTKPQPDASNAITEREAGDPEGVPELVDTGQGAGASGGAPASEPGEPAVPAAASLVELFSLTPDALYEGEQDFDALLKRLRAGERQAARDFARQREECRGLIADNTVRALMEHGSEAEYLAASDDRRTIEGRPMRVVRERKIAQLRTQISNCFPFYIYAVADLREEIKRLALNGNVAARAVYAMWPPHRDLAYPTLEDQHEWEVLSLEFSLANLEAGEFLGFEVFASSYFYGKYFTPVHEVTAASFVLAGARCGFPASQVHKEQLFGVFHRRGYEFMPSIFVNLIVKMSDELRRYCRSSVWWNDTRATEYLHGLSTS